MKMLSISSLSNTLNTLILTNTQKNTFFFFLSPTSFSSSSGTQNKSFKYPLNFSKNPSFPLFSSRKSPIFIAKVSSDSEPEGSTTVEDEWISRLPDKKKPLYAHSLPCIEAWLKSLGFYQSSDDRAVWFIEKSEWHAQLSLDITDLNIRYLKNGPGNLEKDMERRFSYALSREDIENAVLGGP